MIIVNLGGYGGCMLTTVIRKFNQPAYPFDWNITSQSFVTKCIASGGKHFFDFNIRYLRDGFLLSPDNDAFLFHEYARVEPWWVENDEVRTTYQRRLHRLLSVFYSTDEILFCRHAIDEDPYNDYAKSSWSVLPFVVTYDRVKLWENFIHSRPNSKLLLLTNNPQMASRHQDVYIEHITDVRGDRWTDQVHSAIQRLVS